MATYVIQDGLDTGATYFALIKNSAGNYWTGTGNNFAAANAITVNSAKIAMAPDATFTNNYIGVFPIAINTTGSYLVEIYKQAGGTALASDVLVGPVAANVIFWDGVNHTEITEQQTWSLADNINTIISNMQPRLGIPIGASLSAEVEALSGSGSIGGVGTRIITSDSGGTDNLRVLEPDGVTAANEAMVFAYLTSEYTSSPTTAPLRGWSITGADGRWGAGHSVVSMMINPGTYTIVAHRGNKVPAQMSLVVV